MGNCWCFHSVEPVDFEEFLSQNQQTEQVLDEYVPFFIDENGMRVDAWLE